MNIKEKNLNVKRNIQKKLLVEDLSYSKDIKSKFTRYNFNMPLLLHKYYTQRSEELNIPVSNLIIFDLIEMKEYREAKEQYGSIDLLDKFCNIIKHQIAEERNK